MDFIGSKIKLNDWLFDMISKSVPISTTNTFVDACCGSGAVSRYAAIKGYTVIANDIMKFPPVVANGSIGLSKSQLKDAHNHIDYLNTAIGTNGFFYDNFCKHDKIERLYFTCENAKLIDQIRWSIELIPDKKIRDYLLYCGIEALSRVSNTAGTHGAYLKQIKPRAKDRFTLRPEVCVDGKVICYCKDIFDLLSDKEFNSKHGDYVLYIDPPYNHRQYPPNYHLYETFVEYDNPNLTGITGLRPNWQTNAGSLFCNSRKCLSFLKQILDLSKNKHVFMSYSSDGLLSDDDIKSIYPSYVKHEMIQRRYKADSSPNREYDNSILKEYLFHFPPCS